MYVYYNPNPLRRNTGDCVVRAISKLMGMSWDETFIRLSLMAYLKKDNLEKNHVWGDFLIKNGYRKRYVEHTCPYCINVRDFAAIHPYGEYLLKLDSLIIGHVVTVIDGNYYDTDDSGDEIVEYYYE